MDFSDHQQYQYYFQQQQQQEEAAAAAYDPSQSQYQSYDPYYTYHHHLPQQQFYDYSSTHTYPQTDPIPGPAAATNPAAAAAVEALSQLSQFAGTMDAAERAMAYGGPPTMLHYQMDHGHVSVGPAGGGGGRWSGGPLRGGGRRGGGPFRGGGGGRGNFSHQLLRQNGGVPAPSRGTERGRGRGRMGGKRGGRKQHHSASDSQPTHTATEPVVEQSSAPDGGKQQAALILPRHPFLPFAWCDICRVDCNSLEILEQHKNGKRHKKTVQRVEEIQRHQKLFAELQAKVMPDMMLPSAVTESAVVVGEVENVSVAPENITTAAVLSSKSGEAAKAFVTVDNTPVVVVYAAQVDDVNKTNNPETIPNIVLTTQQGSEAEADRAGEGLLEPAKVGGATEAPLSAASVVDEPPTEGSTEPLKRRSGMKRKMTKFGRGGKRLKGFEPVQGRVPERLKERPRVCTLCNVLCESQVVFESHISGKKHTSKIKRFQGQGTVYGPITVYIPPNQPSAYPSQGQEPLFYGLRSREMLPNKTYMGPNGLQVENYSFHEGVQGAQDKDAEGGIPEPQAREGLENSEGVVPANGDKEVSIMDNIENQDASAAAIDFASNKPHLLPVAPETASSEAEAVLSLTQDVLPVPESVVLSGDAKGEQPK